MHNLCIIPARGGSKRIPRKNIKDFLGKPIIAYSIEVALKSGLFDEVMVSTDDEEIAEVARKYGAKVPFMRSAETANDFATLADVVDEVIGDYKKLNKNYEYVCCMLPTAPLITIENLRKGFDLLKDSGADSVKPIVRFSYPIQRALRLVNGRTEMFYPEHKTSRSQDLEPAFHDAGQFYWMSFEKGLRGNEKLAFEISSQNSQDIDNMTDWEITEIKYLKQNKIRFL